MEKNALVTGADRGLGLDLVEQLLQQGFTVFAGQYMKDWPDLGNLQSRYPESLELVPLDVSKDESVTAAAQFVTDRTDHLDILFNNAGISGGKDNSLTAFDALDFDWAQHVYNVNTVGPLRVTNALLPLVMNSETKLVVNISSEAGSIKRSYRKGWFAYCMAKAALNMQSSIVHNNIYPQGGQVLVIHPGYLQSYITGKKNLDAATTTEEAARQILGIIADRDMYRGKEPTFIDHEGTLWPW